MEVAGTVATPELLAYYQQRLSNATSDRDAFFSRIEELKAGRAELHALEWGWRRCRAELTDARDEISQLKAELANERQRLCAVTRDNEELALALRDEERKMQHLLSVTNPRIEEVTYACGAPPQKLAQYCSSVQPSGQRVVRVVYMATEKNDQLEDRVQQLEARLLAQQKQHLKDVELLSADREDRDRSARDQHASASEEIHRLAERNQWLEEQLDGGMKDLLASRFQHQQVERELRERVATLEACNTDVSKALQLETSRMKALAARASHANDVREEKKVSYHRSEEIRAKKKLKSVTRKVDEVEAASAEQIRALRGKVQQLVRQQQLQQRHAEARQSSLRHEADSMGVKLSAIEAVLQRLAGAEADRLRADLEAARRGAETLRSRVG